MNTLRGTDYFLRAPDEHERATSVKEHYNSLMFEVKVDMLFYAFQGSRDSLNLFPTFEFLSQFNKRKSRSIFDLTAAV